MAILSIRELRELRQALVQVFAYIGELQKTNAMAYHIKAPQIPSGFSESLTVHLLKSGKILSHLQNASLTVGGSADVVATQDGVITKIEVKATGDKGFQRFGQKDLAADYLVWIHFNAFFKGTQGQPIVVWTLAKPGRFFLETGILNIAKLKNKAGSELIEHAITFNDLQ